MNSLKVVDRPGEDETIVIELLQRGTVRAIGAKAKNSDPVGPSPVGEACLVKVVREGFGWLPTVGRQFPIQTEVLVIDGVESKRDVVGHVCNSPNTFRALAVLFDHSVHHTSLPVM